MTSFSIVDAKSTLANIPDEAFHTDPTNHSFGDMDHGRENQTRSVYSTEELRAVVLEEFSPFAPNGTVMVSAMVMVAPPGTNQHSFHTDVPL